MQNKHAIPELDASGLRKFAFTFGIIICLLFGLLIPYLFNYSWPKWPWIFAAIVSLWGGLLPKTFNIVYQVWMRFGLLMSKITTPLILGILFYIIITPAGIIMRIIKKDPMQRKFDADAVTYRVLSDETIKTEFERPY